MFDRIQSSAQVQCIAPVGDRCGEGVLWHPDEGAVYWTDINRFLVHRYSLADSSTRTWLFDEPVTTVLLTSREGLLALVIGSGVILWRPENDARSPHFFHLAGWPFVRCNDAGVDANGSIWIGTMRNNVRPDGSKGEEGGKDGVLLRVDPDGSVTTWEEGLGIANTIAWSPDRRNFYFADSLANTIDRYDYDERKGEIARRTSFLHQFGRGAPDGSATDEEGCLWNCRYGGSCIIRVSPAGDVVETVELPVPNITNCTFGGPRRQTLYVTTAHSPERLSGSLFAFETAITGMPDHRFEVRRTADIPS